MSAPTSPPFAFVASSSEYLPTSSRNAFRFRTRGAGERRGLVARLLCGGLAARHDLADPHLVRAGKLGSVFGVVPVDVGVGHRGGALVHLEVPAIIFAIICCFIPRTTSGSSA